MKKRPYSKPKTTLIKVHEPAELMDFLLAKMGGMSRNAVKSLLANRQVLVNNEIISRHNFNLKPNDVVSVSSIRGNIELKHPKVRLLYEDQHIIVIDKREGLLSVGTGKKDEITAYSILKEYLKKKSPENKIFIVHRIDRETSGILMFAKTPEVQEAMQENWVRAKTKRLYIAVVEGKVEKQEDTLISWITENNVTMRVSSHTIENFGKKAITHYKRLQSNEHYSLLEIELETGRKNQIRVHLQETGHSIIGDRKYGAAPSPIGRMGLHARLLSFTHPVTKELMTFEIPIPRSFLSLFN